MKRFFRMIAASMTGLLVAFGAASTPASAAGLMLYVDDDPGNNGSVSCPSGATTYTSLADAVTSLGGNKTNVTITLCPGIYPPATNAVSLDGFTGLKLIGRGGPLLHASGYGGNLITISNSSRVLVSGLYLSGAGTLGSGNASAIAFSATSGTITGNVISDWHQNYNSTLTQFDGAIWVWTTNASQTVTIDKNTIFDAQDYGILYRGPAKAKITKNKIVMHSDISVTQPFDPAPRVQGGVWLLEAGPGGVVSGNVIESNAGMEPFPCVGFCVLFDYTLRGVLLLQTSGAKVTGNTISHTFYGVSVESWCTEDSGSEAHADKNVISGNLLTDNKTGVYVLARDYQGMGCTPHADKNVIKGNRFNRDTSTGGEGARFTASGVGTAAGNSLVGNSFYGYVTTPSNIVYSGAGDSGSVIGPNKIITMPLAGVTR